MMFAYPPEGTDKKGPYKLQIFNTSGFELPFEESKLHQLMGSVEEHEHVVFKMIEVVYVDESEIVSINKEHLNHDDVTDIITFRYDDEEEDPNAIEGTLYCCATRIAEQSAEYATDLTEEFCRVFIHGLLHLAGYNDKSETDKKKMTELENYYLSLLK